ncbi:GntR family transcriptional regulator [Steroidobacter sp. S1-65]|uniref:GntR family transcriptional regulator n=1 Tax=Steroidobacter gossypii TaxID=2805490 RepID=A0ABS1X1Z8_9GAMM|nr:GntR family transcriptional regulator [Steroidobacter gossypii]MBM0107250.1 GntR family transcriptional regulator [Steroidobacter gossypii]
MVPFRIKLDPGQSIFEQVCFAATRAILAGELKPGEAFPSVRALAVALKIHPNTAHKVVQHLIQDRWLIVKPGLGTLVAQPPKARSGDRKRLLEQDIEQLVVEAIRVGATLDDVLAAVTEQWRGLQRLKAVSHGD